MNVDVGGGRWTVTVHESVEESVKRNRTPDAFLQSPCIMKDFRTYQLALDFYRQCQTAHVREPIKNQFSRATLSLILNLAEGAGKITPKDKRKFYSIAMGSLREVQCILELIERRDLFDLSQPLAASLYRLIQNPGGSHF